MSCFLFSSLFGFFSVSWEALRESVEFKLSLGYASPEAEVEVLMAHRTGEAIDTIGLCS